MKSRLRRFALPESFPFLIRPSHSRPVSVSARALYQKVVRLVHVFHFIYSPRDFDKLNHYQGGVPVLRNGSVKPIVSSVF